MIKKDSKIAVIGGGLGGLVIATGLEKKGYSNVTVLEKENRAGGKVHTIWYKGKSYELGAIFGLSVQKNLKSLVKEFNVKIDGPNLSRVSYDIKGNKIMQIPKALLNDFLLEVDRLPDILENYKSLEKVNINQIEERLTWPFSKWCDYHQLKVLKRLYLHHYTSYGLGHIETIPALYVLRIMSYETAMFFLEIPEYLTWKSGVSSLIESMSNSLKDIRLSQNVSNLRVSNRGGIVLTTDFQELEYDCVIIASPVEQFAEALKVQDAELGELLKCIKYQDYNVYSFLVEQTLKGSGCILENLSSKRKGHIVIWNSRWESNEEENLLTVYAYKHPNHSKAEALALIEDDLLNLGIRNPRLYHFQSWKQCPYVESEVLKKGFYDKVEDLQGKNNIFIAGEIMSTVTLEKVIRYSKYIVDRYF